jgi:hypothetical protein
LSQQSGSSFLIKNITWIIVIILVIGATAFTSIQNQSNQQALSSIEGQVSILRNQTVPTVTVTPTTTVSVTITPTVTVTSTIPPILSVTIENATASASGGISLNVINNGNTPLASITMSVTPVLGSDTFSCVSQNIGPGQTTVCMSKGSTLPSETKSYHIQVIASNVEGYFVAAVTVTAGP